MVKFDIFLGPLIHKEAFPLNSANDFKNLIPEELRDRISNATSTQIAVNRVYSYNLNAPRFLINLKGCSLSEIGGGERGSLVSCQRTFSEGSYTNREEEEVYHFSPPHFIEVKLRHHSIFHVNLSSWHGEELTETGAVIIIHATIKLEENKMDDLKKSYFLTLTRDKECQFNSEYLNQPINLASENEVGVSSLILPRIPNIRPPFNYIDVVFHEYAREGENQEQFQNYMNTKAEYRNEIGRLLKSEPQVLQMSGEEKDMLVPKYVAHDPFVKLGNYTKRVILNVGNYNTVDDLVRLLNSSFQETFKDPWWWSMPESHTKIRKLGNNFHFREIGEKIIMENRSDLTVDMLMKEKLAKILGFPIFLSLDSGIDEMLEERKAIEKDELPSFIIGQEPNPKYGLPKFIAGCSPIASHSFIGSQMHKILCLFLLPQEDKEGGYSIMFQNVKFINANPGIFNNMELVFYDPFEGPIDFGEKECKTFISFFLK